MFYLTSDREKEHGSSFTHKAALEVLRVYRATLEYAALENGESGHQAVQVEEDSRNELDQGPGPEFESVSEASVAPKTTKKATSSTLYLLRRGSESFNPGFCRRTELLIG
ncbi:hypothetical protein AU381_05800 [Sinorhizobium glycinis]|uniref:Uncharacterized protein n=1 Tax=Sinorhizobium glycinis TaxID=1472378 RepID=A0A178Y314_9HYPH|nr:hypothetical protein AU381_05800 [Sinorhizobium glycinis]